MAEEVKFTEEEMTEIKELQNSFNSVTLQLGQLEVEKIILEKRSAKLEEAIAETKAKFEENAQKEQDLVNKFSEKYGAGTLNPSTGVFTPTTQPETPAQN